MCEMIREKSFLLIYNPKAQIATMAPAVGASSACSSSSLQPHVHDKLPWTNMGGGCPPPRKSTH